MLCAGKVSRKDQILNAAFEMIRLNNRWSLSDVAERVGVSKTALYRHYRNKAELEESMQERLATEIINAVSKTDLSPAALRAAMRDLFIRQGGLLNLFLNSIFAGQNFEESLTARIRSLSPLLNEKLSALAAQSPEQQLSTAIHFLKNAATITIASFPFPKIAEIQKRLLDYCGSGFPSLPLPKQSRMDELDTLCAIAPEERPESGKLFSAIARTVETWGINETTIERIAEEMGKAKSSLYFYYKTKEEMLDDLTRSENRTIINLCLERAPFGANLAEQLYILMSVQSSYLIARPEIVSVFNWIRYESFNGAHKHEHPDIDLSAFLKSWKIDELAEIKSDTSGMLGVSILKWASLLSTSTIIQGHRQKSDTQTLKQNVRRMYFCMMRGDKEIL